MKLSTLFKKIESDHFTCSIGAASTRALAFEVIKKHPYFNSLYNEIVDHEDLASLVLKRIGVISTFNIDSRYENPHDAALAAYMLALENTHPEFSRIAVSIIISLPNLWWAREAAILALSQISAPTASKESTTSEQQVGQAGWGEKVSITSEKEGIQYALTNFVISIDDYSITKEKIRSNTELENYTYTPSRYEELQKTLPYGECKPQYSYSLTSSENSMTVTKDQVH